jgi:hypothetical protein
MCKVMHFPHYLWPKLNIHILSWQPPLWNILLRFCISTPELKLILTRLVSIVRMKDAENGKTVRVGARKSWPRIDWMEFGIIF